MGILRGNALISGVVTQIANGTIALTASTTNYIEGDANGRSRLGKLDGVHRQENPLYSVVVGSSTVTKLDRLPNRNPDITCVLTKALSIPIRRFPQRKRGIPS